MTNKNNVYQIITNKILDSLKENIIPWKQPWINGPYGIPRNWNGIPYRGINIWLLSISKEFTYPFWFGLKKVLELGGRVKRDEFLKHRICVYYKIINPVQSNDPNIDTNKTRFLLRFHKVWNLDQLENFKTPANLQNLIDSFNEKRPNYDKKEECEKIIEKYIDRPIIEENEQQAYYSPSKDLINMPRFNTFDSVDSYYATLFHELVHSTGHEKRLDRKNINKNSFGDHSYSQEELVAEFGSSFLCAMSGIEQTTIQDAASYIKHWFEKLQNNPQMAIQAAQSASKACDYILGVKYQNSSIEKQEVTV